MYFSKVACGTCWESKSVKLSVKACFCISGERAASHEVEDQEAVQVCPQCKTRCPREVDAQNRYWCAQCKVRQRISLCSRCHADWKECTCRLVVQQACPKEACPGRIAHDAKRDSMGRARCNVCKERQASRQADSMACAERCPTSKRYLSARWEIGCTCQK